MANYTKIKEYMIAYLENHLPSSLTYHGVHHTLEVLDSAIEIASAENISNADLELLKIAVLFHDSGFSKSYTGHEEKSCENAREILPLFDATPQEIETVCSMIEATVIPQKPKTILEKIIADADLLYLGTKRFKDVGDTLFAEMGVYFKLLDYVKWNELQIAFMQNHHFHTSYCLQNYEPVKQQNLQNVIATLQSKL